MRKLAAVSSSSVLWIGALVVVAAALAAGNTLFAQIESAVGYVDVERLINEYLVPVLDEPLARETARLQAEFDTASADLPEEEKLELFRQYQNRLDAIKQRMVDEQLPFINDAVAAVAQRQGVTVVLDRQVVLYGGVDLTEAVLAELAAGR